MNTRPIRFTHRARGFTLVELMVALAIGLMMAFGLVRVFASSSESYQALSQASQQIENGRYAIQEIGDDIKHAGYYGEWVFAPPAGGGPPDPCAFDTVSLRAALGFYVQAYNNVGASPLTCISNANIQAGTDILVIRRVNTVPTVLGALVANEVYMQGIADDGNPLNPVIALGSQSADFSLMKKDFVNPAEIRKFRVHIYYVSPCSEPVGANCSAAADGGRPIPTLKRLSLQVDGAVLTMRNESIAEGIENLQIDFGVDTDGDGLPDGAFVAAPGVWSDVMAAQVYVLARTPERATGIVDNKTYNLGTAPAVVAPGDLYRRHLFTAQFRMVNPAGRREVP